MSQVGRPPVYTGKKLEAIVEKLRRYGITGTIRRMKDKAPSYSSLSRYVKDHKIKLRRGRPAGKKAA